MTPASPRTLCSELPSKREAALRVRGQTRPVRPAAPDRSARAPAHRRGVVVVENELHLAGSALLDLSRACSTSGVLGGCCRSALRSLHEPHGSAKGHGEELPMVCPGKVSGAAFGAAPAGLRSASAPASETRRGAPSARPDLVIGPIIRPMIRIGPAAVFSAFWARAGSAPGGASCQFGATWLATR